MNGARIEAFFDEATYTVSYVVSDPATGEAAVVDPVLDYDANAGRTTTQSADKIIAFLVENQLTLTWILETHVHADHLSGAQYIKSEVGGRIAIGAGVSAVQRAFQDVYNLDDFATDGRQFDHLFEDNESFSVGHVEARSLATPGHTPSCVTYVIGDAAFVGDTLFMPDFGTARTDFPGGSANDLYASIQKILSLPNETRLYMCHDYKAPGRDVYAWETSVQEQRDKNIHVHSGVSESDFVKLRETRDGQLGMPKLLLPSIQVNIRAGQLPEAEENGIRYLKIPVDAL